MEPPLPESVAFLTGLSPILLLLVGTMGLAELPERPGPRRMVAFGTAGAALLGLANLAMLAGFAMGSPRTTGPTPSCSTHWT